jgi:nucleoside-diphosphate-sugar epimerase
VLASSATVYGEGTLSQHLECSPVRPTSAYAASKIGAEALVNAYAALGRIEPLILRLVANVGTGASHGLLPDIINKLKSKGGTIELIGDSPGTIKQFCHVDDTCMVAATLAFSGHSGIFNAVSYDSSPISVESVARIAMESTGITKKIKWLGGSSIWPGDNRVVNIAGQKLYMETNIVVSDSVKAIAIASKELYEEARV